MYSTYSVERNSILSILTDKVWRTFTQAYDPICWIFKRLTPVRFLFITYTISIQNRNVVLPGTEHIMGKLSTSFMLGLTM